MIPIFIPTIGRDRIITLEQMPTSVRKHVTIVTNNAQARNLGLKYGVKSIDVPTQPEPGEKGDGITKGITPTRQWIVNYCRANRIQQCLFIEDDVTFYIRKNLRDLTDWHARLATPREVDQLMKDMTAKAKRYAMVGLSVRQGNNRYTEPVAYNKRMWGCWTIDVTLMNHLGIKFEADFMEDLWVQMSFLRKGYETLLITDRMQNPLPTNAPGGCSTYRTKKRRDAALKMLLEEFPGYITPRPIKMKKGWFSKKEETIIDVTFHGAKALSDARRDL